MMAANSMALKLAGMRATWGKLALVRNTTRIARQLQNILLELES